MKKKATLWQTNKQMNGNITDSDIQRKILGNTNIIKKRLEKDNGCSCKADNALPGISRQILK